MVKKISLLENIKKISLQPLQLFLLLWITVYYLDITEHWRGSMEFILVLCSIALHLFFPFKKYISLSILSALQASLISKLPVMANHNLIMFLGNFLIAAHIVWPGKIRSETFARCLVLCLSVVYFWAGFHKINTDFIYGGYGCSNFMIKNIFWNLLDRDFLETLGSSVWPALSIIIAELLISLCLFCNPLFVFGASLLLLFQSIIILSGIVDFAYVPLTILIYVSLVFLEDKKGKESEVFTRNILLVFFGICFFSSLGMAIPSLLESKSIHYAQVFSWWVLALFLFKFLVRNRKHIKGDPLLQRQGWSFINKTFPLLFLIIGSTSYIGAATTRNFSMFSNLRTEGREWNHLILPKTLRFLPYQDEIYWIQEVDAELLFSFRENPMLHTGIVPFEVQRLYRLWRERSQWPKNFIVKRDSDGKVADIREWVPESPHFSALSMKLMYFRPIRYGTGAECMW